jgi:hypothetical protein
LDAIESGNLYKVFPNAKDRKIIIRIVAMYEPNSDVLIFLKRTEEILKSAGYGFGFKVLKN